MTINFVELELELEVYLFFGCGEVQYVLCIKSMRCWEVGTSLHQRSIRISVRLAAEVFKHMA